VLCPAGEGLVLRVEGKLKTALYDPNREGANVGRREKGRKSCKPVLGGLRQQARGKALASNISRRMERGVDACWRRSMNGK